MIYDEEEESFQEFISEAEKMLNCDDLWSYDLCDDCPVQGRILKNHDNPKSRGFLVFALVLEQIVEKLELA